MALLAIESSGESCSAALLSGDRSRLLEERAPRRHAERLLPMVRELLADAELSLESLDAIAFDRGPGSFTSLRIGIGLVQGLAWGAELPVMPVSSLAALAQAAAREIRPAGRIRILVARDARMNEVYCGCFEYEPGEGLQPVGDERLLRPEALVGELSEAELYAGSGFRAYDMLAGAVSNADVLPEVRSTALDIAALALDEGFDTPRLDAAHAQPVYLRNKVADEPAANGQVRPA